MKKIRKDVQGSNADVKEYDIVDLFDREPAPADAPLGDFDQVSIRLGDTRTFNVVSMPNEVKPLDVPGMMLAAPDDFLRGDDPAYIGGAEKGNPAGGRFWSEEAGAYVLRQPDENAREMMNFPASGDSPITGPANFQAPAPGDIGGRPTSSYVVKRGPARGVFRSAVFGEHADLADSFLNDRDSDGE